MLMLCTSEDNWINKDRGLEQNKLLDLQMHMYQNILTKSIVISYLGIWASEFS